MNAQEAIKEILRQHPVPPNRRASHGQWVDAAWIARGLAEKGWTVSDAVRQVVSTLKLHPPDKAFRGIRACYYTIRNKPWPAQPQDEI